MELRVEKMAMTLIRTVTVGSGGSSTIDFSDIPQTFSDLLLVFSTRPGSTDTSWIQSIQFNGLTTNLSMRTLEGDGASASSGTNGTRIDPINQGSTSTTNTFASGQAYITNYAGSTNKSVSIDSISETNTTTAYQRFAAGVWSNTAAITRITLVAPTTYAQYSSASLYGVSNSVTNGVAKATGGTITYGIGGIVYHTFTSSGTFTPSSSFTADVLVVGGGGKGASGGGGAGGYRTGSLTVSSPVTVTVGAGQAGLTWADGGGQGSSSTFDSITSAGGGGGGAVNANNAGAGGSGGGSGGSSGPTVGPGAGNTPSTSPAQGFNGGSWNGNANNQYAAGGGGASAVGANNQNSAGGAGGAGTTWLNGTTYAVGGKGMEANGTGASAGANTGGGGAGGFTGGSGGSGIVIVRYQG